MTLSTSVGRRRRVARRALLSMTTVLCSGLAAPALAQLAAPAPVHQSVDANGVDLFMGTLDVDAPGISMGQGDQGLSYHQLTRGGSGWTDSVTAALSQSGSTVTVSMGGTTDQFTASGTTYTATQGNGATLVFSNNVYTYTRADGTVVNFASAKSSPAPYYANLARVTDIELPSGTKLVFAYDSIQYCTSNRLAGEPDYCTGHATAFHLTSVTNSYGYRLTFVYGQFDAANYDPDNVNNGTAVQAYSTPTGVTETNLEQSGSGGQTLSFGFTNGSGNGTYTVTDPLERMTSYRMSGGQVAGITRPGSSSEDVTVAYSNGRVSSVKTAAGTWNYSSYDLDGAHTVTVTDPASQQMIYGFDIASQRMTGMSDALHQSTGWQYDANGRVKRVTGPEGDKNGGYTAYVYDDRGNVKEVRQVAKSSAPAPDIVTSAAYPTTCDNALTCNEPTSTTDANQNTTEYTYDPTHGGVLTATSPAPTPGAVQPQVRYGYSALTDYFGGTVYRQTSTSACANKAGIRPNYPVADCVGTSDEVVTSTSYGSVSANNLLPVGASKGAGDGSLTATTQASYDAVGNLVASTDPLGNVTRQFYDAARQLTETVAPDPDGSGPAKSQAATYAYTQHGLVASVAAGSANADGSGFVSVQGANTTYDAADRKSTDTITAGGNTYALTQYSYDPANRVMCAAVRMNPAAWSSLPGDACTLGAQGSNGPDRITRAQMDEIGRSKATISAYGTPSQAIEASLTYTPDGQVATATDANGNVTSYVYNGFDRLIETHYPNPTGGGSSSSDYQQTEYDAAGNLTRRWLRGTNNHQDIAYDALNRPTGITVPHLNASDQNTSYGYDNFGELTSASDQNSLASTFVYDALGRKKSEQSSHGGTTKFGYDLAGQRTKLTWPDGFYVSYAYDNAGNMTGASDTAGAQLFSLSFDDAGRRMTLCPSGKDGGMCSGYGYDAASRLNGLTLAGNSGTSITLGAYNPAGQIGQRQNGNDAYAWTGVNGSKDYSVNGLNQYTKIAGAGLGYDSRGNLISIAGNSYGYDSFNRLGEYNSGQGAGNWLGYDALGRLNWSNAPQVRFDYDGSRLITELDGNGNVRRRYVYGPNPDEPVVWYEGSGTGDKRFLQADERGSVIRVSRADGSTLATNSYDEYGVPASTNQGRFGYTGQTWLPELGLWYYKARMYAPSLGRFMQTDPIGYGDGLSLYVYAHSDPVNGSDPTGLQDHYCAQTPASSLQGRDLGGAASSCDPLPPEVVVTARLAPPPSVSSQPVYLPSFLGLAPPSTVSGTGASAGINLPQIMQVNYQPAVCPQTAGNAAALDYSKLLFKGGTQSTQDHIIQNHLSDLSGKSNYYQNAGFQGVVNDNAFTYQYGVQTFDPIRGLHAFDAPHPGSFLSLIGIDLSYGTTPSGDPAYTNHLVTLGDCKSVLTSYPR